MHGFFTPRLHCLVRTGSSAYHRLDRFGLSKRRRCVPQGTVTRLFKQRGIGFITPDESDRDVFIAMDTIPEVVASLMEGQRVVYDAIEAEGGVKAVSVSIVP
jgi:cold shock CspA family protein